MRFLIFVAGRVLLSVPALLGVLVVTFAIIHLVPGDPIDVLGGVNLDPAVAEQLREQLGLNRPIHEQFLGFLTDLLQGDLGTSYVTKQPVAQIVADRLPYTIALAGAGVGFGLMFSLPAGIIAAWRESRGAKGGAGFTFGTTILLAVPDFLFGTLLVTIFGVYIQIFPVAGAHSWNSIVLPAMALGLPLAGIQARVIRTNMLDTMARPFVRTLRAAGVPENRILVRNVLRNASLPVVTLLSVEFGRLLAGALVVENIFAWPGLGTTIFTAITNRDLPAIQGQLLVIALIILLVNLLIDVLYRIIDPRIGLA